MAFPESPSTVPTFEKSPTRVQLRQSLIADPYDAIIRSVEDIAEQSKEEFERLATEVSESQASMVGMYREILANNFNELLQKIAEERELRLAEFDQQPEDVTPEQLSKWYAGVTTKAASLQVSYTSKARELQDRATMPLTQFVNAHNL